MPVTRNFIYQSKDYVKVPISYGVMFYLNWIMTQVRIALLVIRHVNCFRATAILSPVSCVKFALSKSTLSMTKTTEF